MALQYQLLVLLVHCAWPRDCGLVWLVQPPWLLRHQGVHGLWTQNPRPVWLRLRISYGYWGVLVGRCDLRCRCGLRVFS